MENFRDAAAQGEALGILDRAANSEALGRRFAESLALPDETARRGAGAARFVAANRGAAAATADALAGLAPALADGQGSAS